MGKPSRRGRSKAGRRPCLLGRKALQASTAEQGGPFLPNKSEECRQALEHFPFETLCTSNHTALRFAEIMRFSRTLLTRRFCADASRFIFFKEKTFQGLVRLILQIISIDKSYRRAHSACLWGGGCLVSRSLSPVKARWGRRGAWGEGWRERLFLLRCKKARPSRAGGGGGLHPIQTADSVDRP